MIGDEGSEDSSETAIESLNEKAVELLVDNHRQFRQFLSNRLGGDDALAEDLLQQSLKKALEYPSTSVERQSIFAWFYQILRTALVDHFRAKASGQKKIDELMRERDLHGEEHIKAPDELRAELCRCFEGLLSTLKPAHAELIHRIDLKEEPPEQVAGDLGITGNNLYVRLHRARQALKLSLERACGACTEHGCLNCDCG